MTDSSWDPSPNTGPNPSRASLNSLSTSRSRSPYTVGGRTMVQGNAIARTNTSAASLLWPYGVPPQRPRLGGRTDQTRHRIALGAERPHQVRTDEARPAGDERLHSGLS